MGKMTFCERLLEQLSRATGGEREAIRAELEDHLADHAAMLEEKGVSPEEAMARAEEAMGDPAEIGKALNNQFSPFWLWAKRLAQAAICFLLAILLMSSSGGYADYIGGAWYVLRGIGENWQVRQGDAWEMVGDPELSHNTTHFWRCWQVMRVGEDLVCLTGVQLRATYTDPEVYQAIFYFCTYSEDLLAPANDQLLQQLTLTPEGGVITDPELVPLKGWSFSHGSYGMRQCTCCIAVREGDTYVDVTYDRMGLYATLRCPLSWEVSQ